MTAQIIAWHNEPSLKLAALERVREHQKLDQIVQRVYWECGRGCNLGCLTHVAENTHEATERLLGIPLKIAYWLEAVFEGLAKEKCAQWVLDSTEAIPVGADLSKCHHHLAVWLLSGDAGLLVISDVNRDAIAQVCRCHESALRGEQQDWSAAWSAAESAAWSAAWSAAESAAWSAAWSAAESAAESVESAARSAAESAAWSVESAARSAAWSAESAARSAARSAAWSAAWDKIAARSLEIFRSAPVSSSSEAMQPCVRQELCSRGIWCPDDALVRV